MIHPAFVVPRYPEGELASSTLVLASRLELLGDRPAAEKFAYGGLKVIPNLSGVFRAKESLGVYLQVYNVAVDQATLRPRLEVAYIIKRQGREVARVGEDGRNGLSRVGGPQVALGRLIPLRELKPGFYDLTVEITDRVAGRTLRRTEPFQVSE